jgi:GntR family transcriptional regulator
LYLQIAEGELDAQGKVRGDAGMSRPLHRRIGAAIREQALSGQLVDENGRLKTEAELVEHFGVSRVTIRNALAPLVAEGLFERTPRRGTFLKSNRSEQWVGRLLGFQEFIAEAGYTPGAKILRQGMTKSLPASVREALDQRVAWELHRVRYADDVPMAIEHAYYPAEIGLDLEQRDLKSIAIYRVIEEELGIAITGASQTMSAKLSDAEEDEELGLEATRALVLMERITKGPEGATLEYLQAVYRPDFFQFSIDLRRRLT